MEWRIAAIFLGVYLLALAVLRPPCPKELPSVAQEESVHAAPSFEPLSDLVGSADAPTFSNSWQAPPPPRPTSTSVILPRHEHRSKPPRPPIQGVVIGADKIDHLHNEFVYLTLRAESTSHLRLLRNAGPRTITIRRFGRPVSTVGEMTSVTLRYDPEEDLFAGRWPVPWNAPDGDYLPHVSSSTWPKGVPLPKTLPFRVLSRPFDPLPPGFAVLTLEGYRNPERIPGPDGIPSIDGLPAWARFMGVDAVFVQGGESSGFEGKPSADFPWKTASLSRIRALGEACHARGLKLGVYVLCYMLGGPPENSPDYQYGWNYDKEGLTYGLNLEKRRGISIADPDRPGDVVAVLKRFQAMSEVDWLGLDYIRPAFGSCELVDDFVEEMPGVVRPEGFDLMTPEERMTWICRGRFSAPRPELRSEPRFVLSDQWFWYRAYRTAEVVQSIVKGLGPSKPVWAYTLSWNKGWEHGQDPCMMRDAGLSLDMVMLYEADEMMFRGLVSQWGRYARRDQLNVIVGNQTDWVLHQKTLDPSGPEAYRDRILRAVRGFHSDQKPARGVFIHDIHRILTNGRRMGPYKTMEWALAAGEAVTETRRLHGALPFDVTLEVPDRIEPEDVLTVSVALKDPSSSTAAVSVRLFAGPDVETTEKEFRLTAETPRVSFFVKWTPLPISEARGNRTFLALRASRPQFPEEAPVIRTAYLQGVPYAPVFPGQDTDGFGSPGAVPDDAPVGEGE